MKIVVNAVPLLNIPTGIGRYIRELYMEIGRTDPSLCIRFFNGRELLEEMPESPGTESVWNFLVNLAWRLPPIFPYLARVLMQEKQSRVFKKLSKGFDIYHEPGYFPFATDKSVKTVFTVHDLSLSVLPHYHPKDRVLFHRKYFNKAIKHSDLIITPSDFTRTEIARYYPEMPIRIDSVHQGYNASVFFPQKDSAIHQLKKKLGLPDRYLLFVGTVDPRKNIDLIARLMPLLSSSIHFVCAGWSGWGGESLSGDRKQSNRITYAGYVSDEDLAALYTGARAFVYPSFYEGFGLPVLEAMACGCPVICSDRASLPEIVGEAAITCSPEDPAAFSEAITSIFESDERYHRMSEEGRLRAQKFSWKLTAEKTVALFHHVLSCS